MSKIQGWLYVDKRTRIARILFSALMSVLMIISLAAPLGIHAYAAGSSYSFDDYMLLVAYFEAKNTVTVNGSNYTVAGAKGGDFVLEDPSSTTATKNLDGKNLYWTEISNLAKAREAGSIDSAKMPNAFKLSSIAQVIASNNQIQFTDSVTAVFKSANSSIDLDTRTGSYKATDSAYDKKLKSAVTNFNAAIAGSTATDVFESIYGADSWNPDTGLATEVMATIYSVVNVIFTVVAQIIMWFFIGQTAFDLFYISFEPIRPFIGPVGSSSGMSGNNGMGDGNILSKIHIPICSHAAEEVVSGGGGGGIGGNGAGVNSSTAAVRYLWKRAPLLVSIAIYFILAVMGYWTKIIGWVAEFVIKIANFILSIGG